MKNGRACASDDYQNQEKHPPAKLKMITAIIEGQLNNRACKVPNTGIEPYTLVFAGDDRDWGYIDLGALAIKNVPACVVI